MSPLPSLPHTALFLRQTPQNCQNITNKGLRVACRLPSLTCLNASRCRGITVEGLASLAHAAKRLRRLNLGWCPGLAAPRGRMSISDGGLPDAPVEEAAADEARETEEGVLSMVGVEEDAEGEEGCDEEKEEDAGGEWVLPPLPKLEKLCLAR